MARYGLPVRYGAEPSSEVVTNRELRRARAQSVKLGTETNRTAGNSKAEPSKVCRRAAVLLFAFCPDKLQAMRVAIQGERGSFSHQAAERLVPGATVVPCARSAQVFDLLAATKVPVAVIPIENTLAGSVTEHFDLLLTHDVFIQREFNLRIVHNLIAPRGVHMKDIRHALSHPVALDQCRQFFRRHPQ